MSLPRPVLFVAYRTIPFALFGLYDWFLLNSAGPSTETPCWIEFVIFWGGYLVVPAAILLLGGRYVRTFTPRSSFSVGAVTICALVALLNPFVITCWGLSLGGGACT